MAIYVDYNAVLADLEDQKARINAALDGAIAGIKTMLAMRSQLPHVAPRVQPDTPPKSAQPTEQRRKYAFGRDPYPGDGSTAYTGQDKDQKVRELREEARQHDKNSDALPTNRI